MILLVILCADEHQDKSQGKWEPEETIALNNIVSSRKHMGKFQPQWGPPGFSSRRGKKHVDRFGCGLRVSYKMITALVFSRPESFCM